MVKVSIFQIGWGNLKEVFKTGELSVRTKAITSIFVFGLTEDTIKLSDYGYEEVYNLEVEEDDVMELLEQVFDRFNINQPDDFKGRSLSVSDIVKVDNTYYECKMRGWREITVLAEATA